jgi:predicted NAD/FAD-dependent oxidoreductase
MTTIAIIGAGMAGLAAAERLRENGVACVLFDKSRGFGGRMATRRTGDLQFDHGAQYFSVRGPAFFAQVTKWREAGIVDEWSVGSYVGAPGMTAPARAMAANHECVMEAQVSQLTREAGGWSVCDYAGPIAAPGNGSYRAVILAVPAPQAAPLAASAGAAMPQLADAAYAPCIALMLAFPPETQRPACEWLKPEDRAIAWIARNSSKPGRPRGVQTWVVHARADWSRIHLETNTEDLRAPLLARFRAVTGVHAEPTHVSAHRWRFALVEREIGTPCLFDEAMMVGACGDWCLGARVEAAYDSGCAMADTLLRAL